MDKTGNRWITYLYTVSTLYVDIRFLHVQHSMPIRKGLDGKEFEFLQPSALSSQHVDPRSERPNSTGPSYRHVSLHSLHAVDSGRALEAQSMQQIPKVANSEPHESIKVLKPGDIRRPSETQVMKGGDIATGRSLVLRLLHLRGSRSGRWWQVRHLSTSV